MLFFTAAVCMHAQLFKLYVTLWMVARQVLLSMDSAARTSGETIALTVWIFVGKVMFLLLNTLSRFGIAFLPRSRCLLISWLQSPSAVVLEFPPKISLITFPLFPYLPLGDGTRCHDLSFLNVEL